MMRSHILDIAGKSITPRDRNGKANVRIGKRVEIEVENIKKKWGTTTKHLKWAKN